MRAVVIKDHESRDHVGIVEVDDPEPGASAGSPPTGMPDLRKAIARALSERAGRDLDWEGVVVHSLQLRHRLTVEVEQISDSLLQASLPVGRLLGD